MNYTVIKLGGSILVPNYEGPDTSFVKEFIEILSNRIALGEKFFVCVGGGQVNTSYNTKLKEVASPTNEALDWIGIHTIKLNAEFMKYAFGNLAHDMVLEKPSMMHPDIVAPVIICSAEEPGQSTNYIAVLFAEYSGAKRIINISNIDFVYNADPRLDSNAQSYSALTWDTYQTFIPTEWSPRMSTPFDPIASQRASELDLEVVFMSGSPLDNLANYLDTGECNGTIISNNETDTVRE